MSTSLDDRIAVLEQRLTAYETLLDLLCDHLRRNLHTDKVVQQRLAHQWSCLVRLAEATAGTGVLSPSLREAVAADDPEMIEAHLGTLDASELPS